MGIRNIEFRGQRIDNKEWVYGCYCYAEKHDSNELEHFIIEVCSKGNQYEVIPSTVGEYTGLTDKNGKKIFEGDRLIGKNMLHPSRKNYEITYLDNGFYYFDKKGTPWHPEHIDDIEVIGTIFDEVRGNE